VADLLVNEEDPEAAHNILDNQYLVVYERQEVIMGQRFSPTGALLQSPFEISDADGNRNPTVAYNLQTQSYIVAWEDDEGGQVDVWAISVAGTHQTAGDQFLSPPYAVTNDAKDQTDPNIACNAHDSSCLIVFEYHRTTSFNEINAERVEVAPTAITSGGGLILVGFDDFYSHESPDVVWGEGENNYLVTWVREDAGIGTIWYARIYDTDQGLSSEFMTSSAALWSSLSNDQRNPDAAYEPNSGEYLVVFDYDDTTDRDIWGVRVPGSSGVIENSDVFDIIGISSHSERDPAVAHFGGVFPSYNGASSEPKLMVAYKQYQSPSQVYQLRVYTIELVTANAVFIYDGSEIETYDAADAILDDIFLVGSWGNDRVYAFWDLKQVATNQYDVYAFGLNTEYAFLPLIIN
jgi:hypothetical protein